MTQRHDGLAEGALFLARRQPMGAEHFAEASSSTSMGATREHSHGHYMIAYARRVFR